ncbi:MAG: hypothetical protein ACKN91_03500, partial [Candidatus Fonsibacter sp.]
GVTAVTTASPIKELPDQIAKLLDNAAGQFEKEVKKVVNAHLRLDQAKHIAEFFDQSTNAGRYPAGIRPFKCPTTHESMDRTCTKTNNSDCQWTIVFPKHASRREAMEIAHWNYNGFIKRLELESLEAHVVTMKQIAAKASLLKVCSDLVNDACDPSKFDQLGLASQVFNAVPIFINVTRLGMQGPKDLKFDFSIFYKKINVVDIIYNPENTRFLRYARKSGHKTFSGLDMFIYQAQKAFYIWNKKKPKVTNVVYKKLRKIIND